MLPSDSFAQWSQPPLIRLHYRVLSPQSFERPTDQMADAKEVGVENPAEETFCHPALKSQGR